MRRVFSTSTLVKTHTLIGHQVCLVMFLLGGECRILCYDGLARALGVEAKHEEEWEEDAIRSCDMNSAFRKFCLPEHRRTKFRSALTVASNPAPVACHHRTPGSFPLLDLHLGSVVATSFARAMGGKGCYITSMGPYITRLLATSISALRDALGRDAPQGLTRAPCTPCAYCSPLDNFSTFRD
ncbi:unnamed protein product [Linum trigynum]|uniref:Uncharacterized protein n=1 Tax=Linum trigynum TaxID=586398 RepID=A0AAV2GMP2_9ROSI